MPNQKFMQYFLAQKSLTDAKIDSNLAMFYLIAPNSNFESILNHLLSNQFIEAISEERMKNSNNAIQLNATHIENERLITELKEANSNIEKMQKPLNEFISKIPSILEDSNIDKKVTDTILKSIEKLFTL